MSLFQNTSALGIKPEDIDGCPKLGALGIPEFGTDFAMQMLMDTKPQYFQTLYVSPGLAHGTDVWLGNAQTLIKEGKATISTAICTRDDIMIYLIQKGLDSEESFKIMEMVRKGKVASGKCKEWPEWKQDMIDHGVPDWYIWSCERIKYMFPKEAEGTISNTEEDELGVMRIVQEMHARGYEFTPIDIYKAKARTFQIIDGKIMPSFKVISKVGEVAGESIEIAARDGEFLSKDDLRQRAKIGQSAIDKLSELGILGDMTDSNQLSLFDL